MSFDHSQSTLIWQSYSILLVIALHSAALLIRKNRSWSERKPIRAEAVSLSNSRSMNGFLITHPSRETFQNPVSPPFDYSSGRTGFWTCSTAVFRFIQFNFPCSLVPSMTFLFNLKSYFIIYMHLLKTHHKWLIHNPWLIYSPVFYTQLQEYMPCSISSSSWPQPPSLLFIVVAAMQPTDFRITRTGTITAPASAVFAHVNDLHQWDAWSPWAKLDPNATNSFEGPASGVGAMMRWAGNNKVGQGSMTIMESRPDEFIQLQT